MMSPADRHLATAPAGASEQSRWSWPIDLTRYDRTPELSSDELAALVALDWNVRRGRCHDSTRPEWTTIARLVRPLDDARLSLSIPSTNTPYHQRSALDAVGLILHGCRTHRTAFWQWDETTWIEVLGADQRAFLQRREFSGWLDATVRPYMVAIAYLLECFSAFQLLGSFNRLSLATKVFGPAVVKEAIDQVLTVLQGWGYRSATDQDKYPGLICTLLLLNRSPYLSDFTTQALEEFRTHRAIHHLMRSPIYAIHRAVAALGYVDPPHRLPAGPEILVEGVHATWQQWVERWTATSTLTPKVRGTFRTILLKVADGWQKSTRRSASQRSGRGSYARRIWPWSSDYVSGTTPNAGLLSPSAWGAPCRRNPKQGILSPSAPSSTIVRNGNGSRGVLIPHAPWPLLAVSAP